MALPSTIYRVNLQLADIDRAVYETITTTVARHPSETEERLVARLLAAAVFHQPELVFTKGLSATEEPDLWVKGPDGRVLFWVEVGLPDSDRVTKACRHAERMALLACGRSLANWEQQHLPKLADIANLTVITLEQSFINQLVSGLERNIKWSITLSGGSLYLGNGELSCETVIHVKAGSL